MGIWLGFGPANNQPPNAGSAPIALFADDFIPGNGPDLAIANQNGFDISPVRNNGTGGGPWAGLTFQDDFVTTDFPTALTSADFDGDGIPDLAVAGLSYAGFLFNYESNIRIHINAGDGTFPNPPVRQGTDDFLAATWVGAMNLNDDTAPDLVATKRFSGNTQQGFVTLLTNRPQSEFSPAGALAAGTNPVFAAVADLNNDMRDDLVVVDKAEDKIRVFLRTNVTMSLDCNDNGIPDECDIADCISNDYDDNNVPDECQAGIMSLPDTDGDGVPDIYDMLCPSDYNPIHCAPKDCNGDGTIDTNQGSGENAGEQCNVCSC